MPPLAYLLAADLAVLGEALRGRVNHGAGCAHTVCQESLNNALRDIAGFGKDYVQHGDFVRLQFAVGQATCGSNVEQPSRTGSKLPRI